MSNIESEFPGVTFSASGGRIIISTIEQWCDEAATLIDARIGLLYQTPITEVTSPEAFKLLRMISTQLVCKRVGPKLDTDTGDAETSNKSYYIQGSSAMKLLDRIVSREVILSDAISVSSSSGVSSFTADCTEPHIFKIGVDQW